MDARPQKLTRQNEAVDGVDACLHAGQRHTSALLECCRSPELARHFKSTPVVAACKVGQKCNMGRSSQAAWTTLQTIDLLVMQQPILECMHAPSIPPVSAE